MSRQLKSAASKREAFESEALGLYDQMVAWRRKHSQATFDEIAAQVQIGRKQLMGHLLEELAVQEIEKEQWQEQVCPECGGRLEDKGVREKRVVHSEGEARLARPYYHCKHCGSGFFPLGRVSGIGQP